MNLILAYPCFCYIFLVSCDTTELKVSFDVFILCLITSLFYIEVYKAIESKPLTTSGGIYNVTCIVTKDGVRCMALCLSLFSAPYAKKGYKTSRKSKLPCIFTCLGVHLRLVDKLSNWGH